SVNLQVLTVHSAAKKLSTPNPAWAAGTEMTRTAPAIRASSEQRTCNLMPTSQSSQGSYSSIMTHRGVGSCGSPDLLDGRCGCPAGAHVRSDPRTFHRGAPAARSPPRHRCRWLARQLLSTTRAVIVLGATAGTRDPAGAGAGRACARACRQAHGPAGAGDSRHRRLGTWA